MTYTISQASELLGIPPSTLRYYDGYGVIPTVKRNEGGQRVYSDSDLALIAALRRGTESGMKLSEFRELYHVVMMENDYSGGKDLLLRKRKELEEKIITIQASIAYIDSLLPEYDRRIVEEKAQSDA